MNCLNLIVRPPSQSFVGATTEKLNIFAKVCGSSKSPFESNKQQRFSWQTWFCKISRKRQKRYERLAQTSDKDKSFLDALASVKSTVVKSVIQSTRDGILSK